MLVLLGAAVLLVVPGTPASAGASRPGGSRPSAVFSVGAAVVPINPARPVFMGGFGGGPPGGTVARHVDPLTGRPESFSVRAISIEAGGRVVELARVDTQGYFAGYEEGPYGISDVRQAVAAFLRRHGVRSASEADIIVSSDHEHAAPSIIGIWGPFAHNEFYLKQVFAATTRALEAAYLDAEPATLAFGTVEAPWLRDETVVEGNVNEGWPVDGSLFVLRATSVATGATIATYAVVPGYPNQVFGPADVVCPPGTPDPALLATDFPTYTEQFLEERLGGIALVAVGSLADETGPLQGDTAPSPDLPPAVVAGRSCHQTRGFDDAINVGTALGVLTLEALGSAHPIDEAVVGGAEQYVVSPVENAPLVLLNDVAPLDGGAFWAKAGADRFVYPIDRATTPPYAVGLALGTWVTGLRIGPLFVISEPGEFSASIHQAFDEAVRNAAAVVVVGAAQDFLGYEYPAYAYPFVYYGDEQFFNPSVTLGDQVVTAGELDARALGFDASLTTSAEATALENRYLAMTEPGAQLLAFPDAGDASTRTDAFAPVLEAVAGPSRLARTASCDPPLPLELEAPTATGPCPLGPAPRVGPFRFRFGDGTGAVVSADGLAAEDTVPISPYLRHPYRSLHPGATVYDASVTVRQSDGQVAKMTLPITVYPPLSASAFCRWDTCVAEARGGTGQLLAVTWRFSDGAVRYGARVTPPSHAGRFVVELVDSTGTLAEATGAA